jgi:hypothetical protein
MGDEFDPIARMRAEMDQAREGIKEIPGVLWGFYTSAVEAGFSEAEAFRLTLKYMAVTFAPQAPRDDNE